MKKALVVCLVLIVAIVLLPFYGGIRAKQAMDDYVAAINDAPGYHATIDSYENTWLTTDAVLKVSLTFPKVEGETESIDLPVIIAMQHGPLLVDSDDMFGWFNFSARLSQEHSDFLKKYLVTEEEGEVIQTLGQMDLLGNLHFEQVVQAFSYKDDSTSVTFAGLDARGVLSRDRMLDISGSMGELHAVAKGAFSMDMDASSFTSIADYSRVISGANLMPSSTTYKLPTLKMVSEGELVELRDLSLSVDVTLPEDGSVMDMKMLMAIASMQLPNEEIRDLAVNFSYDRISTELVKAYMKLFSEQMEAPVAEPAFAKYMSPEVIAETLAKKPGFSVQKLTFSVPEGRFDGNMSVALSLPEGADGNMLMQNPLMMVNSVTVTSNLQVERALFDRIVESRARNTIEAQLAMQGAEGEPATYTEEEIEQTVKMNAANTTAMLLQQGLIAEEGDLYVLNMKVENGTALVNGVSMPLPLGALMGGS